MHSLSKSHYKNFYTFWVNQFSNSSIFKAWSTGVLWLFFPQMLIQFLGVHGKDAVEILKIYWHYFCLESIVKIPPFSTLGRDQAQWRDFFLPKFWTHPFFIVLTICWKFYCHKKLHKKWKCFCIFGTWCEIWKSAIRYIVDRVFTVCSGAFSKCFTNNPFLTSVAD